MGSPVSSSSSSSHIQLRHVVKTYDLDEVEVHALRDINLDIYEGEVIAILGPSGSGKTTLLNMIGGIDRCTSGEITVLGTRLDQLSDRELTRFRKRNFAYVFQFYSLIPSLTALENIMLVEELIGIKGQEARKRAVELLAEVGLKGREHSFPHQLSGGERQRVAIARALAKRPKILFADEPSGQLDSQTGHKVISLMRDMVKQSGTTLLIVTHDVSLVQYVDRVLHIDSGKIVQITENPSELLARVNPTASVSSSAIEGGK